MGSFFYINVPIRKYEVELRQQEKKINVIQEADDVAKDFVVGKMVSGSLVEVVRRASLDVDGKELTTLDPGLGTKVPPNLSTVDVYEATVDGKKANIIVSKDSMAIYPEMDTSQNVEEALNEVKKAHGTRSSESGDEEIENAISNIFLEKHLEDCLKKFVIYDATWGTSVDGNFSQISFTVSADRSESIISSMVSLGIGTKYESTLSVCSAVVYYNEHQEKKKATDGDDKDLKSDSFGSKFVASIKSRLTVAQVVQSVQTNAIITFDFIIFIIVAAIIAALGLLENSSVNLVASMLISPLMGPIMAQCFGAVIHDKKLVKTGIISEFVGLTLCFLVGFSFGISVAWAPFDGPWHDIPKWPTDEMASRSRLRGLVVGAFVAIPSGAGVALSILAGNAGSLVGVAISASLLPPAVNAGMLWGVAFIHTIHSNDDPNRPCKPLPYRYNSTKDDHGHTKGHEFIYCGGNIVKEFGIMGICSFGLTCLNIALILITGAIVLKIKEVAPHTTRKTMSRFWKEDLKAMRDYNKVHGHFNKQEIMNELNEAGDVRDKLKNDRVFAQVTQRNLFGTSSNILDTTDAAGGDAEEGAGSATSTTGGGGFFSGWFGSSKAEPPPPPPVEKQVQTDVPKLAISNRPHLKPK